ncbi:MAG: thioredoxin family protein [Deltaproteobacteria bacterium]|nr:thioredoxin family protein [Deltaproteobacteria bacterium]
MAVLKEKDKEKVKEIFKDVDHDVTIVMFTQEIECPHCEMTRTMLEEVSGLSDRISLEVHDFVADKDVADTYGVDKIPATVLIGEKDYGIRFYGVPAGYEFTVLIEEIREAGKRDPGLSKEAMAELDKVDEPVHLQVLISPT